MNTYWIDILSQITGMTRMIVFDMAGTTIDENNIVYKTLRTSINSKGFSFSIDQVLEHGAGHEKLAAIENILRIAGVENSSLANEIFEQFRKSLHTAYDEYEVKPQPHALQLFEKLREHQLFIVLNTGYDRVTARKLLDKLNWKEGKIFDLLVTASDVLRSRPFPDMMLLAMDHFSITDAAEVIKVGDSIIDIEEGQNAGCGITAGITSGAHTREQLASAGPHIIIDDLMEIWPLVDSH